MADRVLVTGVAGFIGSNLLDYLLQNSDWDITGIDNFSTGRRENIEHALGNERFEFIEQKCSDLTSLKAYSKIFHLAALPRIQPSFELIGEHVRENLLEGVHLIELMVKEEYFPRLIYSSSSAIYGNPEQFPTTENEPVRCINPYAFQKYELEQYLDILSDRFPLDYVHLRYFNPYGPRSFNPANPFNAYSSVVGIFLNRAQNGEKLLITGDGQQQRDFIHVADVAKANFMAAKHSDKLNIAINVGKGETLSILDLAKMISEDYEFIDARPGEAEMTLADISRAKSLLGWSPDEELTNYIQSELIAK